MKHTSDKIEENPWRPAKKLTQNNDVEGKKILVSQCGGL